MNEEIFQLVSEIIDVPISKMNLNTGPENEPQWDSLAQFTIVSATEDKYKIKLTMQEIVSIKNLSDLINIINSKTK